MSGSSGGNGIPTINRPSGNENCEGLVIITNLASPQAVAIDNLSEGEMLTIQAQSDQGPIVALGQAGELVGTIITREQVRLLSCINAGTEYEAEILMIENGQCQVQIRAI